MAAGDCSSIFALPQGLLDLCCLRFGQLAVANLRSFLMRWRSVGSVPNHVLEVLKLRAGIKMSWIAAGTVSADVVDVQAPRISFEKVVGKTMSSLDPAVPVQLPVAVAPGT